MSVSRPLLLGLGGLALLGVVQWVILPAFEYRADNASRAERARQRHLSMQLLTDDYARLSQSNAAAPAKNRSLFRKALPDVRGSFNPVQMESILKNRIAGLRGGGENDATFPALHLLQDMHAAVPDSLDIRLDRLSLDARRCGLSGTAASYEQVNALRVALSGLPGVREAKILSAASRTGKPEPGTPSGAVIFEIELALEGGQS